MKRVVLLAGALLALTSSLALAAGDINLQWSDCPAAYGGTGLTNNAGPCTSNLGADVLVGSFQAPVPMGQLNGNEGVIDVQVSNATLDSWWRMDPLGPCRAGRLTGSFDFTAGPFSCLDLWAGGASGGIDVAIGSQPNRLRVRTVCAVPDSRATDNVSEYYCLKLTLGHQATVGGSCPGCLDPACIVFNSLKLTQPAGVGDYTLTSGANQYATWRSGVIAGGPCPGVVPTLKSTWGSVKALYR